MDPNLNNLLKWSIQNSEASRATLPANSDSTSITTPQSASDPTQSQPTSSLDPALLAHLFGGPSDADLMRESMKAITDKSISLENREVAFDNFEQLIENLDNANNIAALGLWEPLVGQLGSEEKEMRIMAAWCIGTAVQNNSKAQDMFLTINAIPTLTKLTFSDPDTAVRKKCIYALSSAVRNYQPGLTEAIKYLPDDIVGKEEKEKGVDASDMDAVDRIIGALREKL